MPAPVIQAMPIPVVVDEPPVATAGDSHDPVQDEDVKDLAELLGLPEGADVERALFNPEDPFTVPPTPAATPEPRKGGRVHAKWLAAAAALVVLATAGIASYKVLAGEAVPALATLSVQSNPPGVPVFVDGVERGTTPTRLTLAPGPHILELRRGVPRVIPISLTAGADVSQYLEFVEAPVSTEQLIAQAEAAAPDPVVPPPPVAPLAGWISVKLPFVADIREKGKLLGTTEADRLMLAAGTHELEFVNQTLGFQLTRTVQVGAGRVMPVALPLPRGSVNLNAAPWAEVWLDGVRVGETPIGNLAVPIGPHEIVFKHPQFGEKRHAVSVTAGAPVRVSVDMK
jgi:hypothetical protein